MLLHLASAHVSLRALTRGLSCEALHTLKLVEFYRSHPLSVPKHDLALEKREGGNKRVFRITHSIHNLSSINILICRGKRSRGGAVEAKQLRSSKLIEFPRRCRAAWQRPASQLLRIQHPRRRDPVKIDLFEGGQRNYTLMFVTEAASLTQRVCAAAAF